MKLKNFLVAALIAVVSLVGCNKTSTTDPATDPTSSAAVSNEPISIEQLDEIGKNLVAAVQKKDGKTLSKYMDYSALIDRILAPYDLESQVKAGFSTGFLEELEKKPLGLFTEMADSNVKFVRSHELDGQSRILIRIIAPEDVGGFQFVDLLVENRPGGLKVVDYYTYFGGEMISAALGRLLAPALKQAGTSGGDDEMGKVEDLQRLFQAIANRDFEKADSVYKAMDKDMRDKKFVQLMYLQVAVELGDDIYLEALQKFEKDFPGDPSLVLVQLDSFFLKKEYQRVVDDLNALQASLDIQDAYVKTLQATALAESGQQAEALKYLKDAVKLEPELEDARWALIEVAMEVDDFSVIADNLNALLPDYPDLVEGVPSQEFYKPFMESQVGKDWLKAAEAKAK
jgi:tetratricopeptide (TPR) repeat protein